MIVLPKGSHLNGHTDHGLFIHPQTQTLELHAISTKLKSRRWGGGGEGGRGSLVWLCLSVLQMLTLFQTKAKYVTPSRGSLENHTRFRTNMNKIYTPVSDQNVLKNSAVFMAGTYPPDGGREFPRHHLLHGDSVRC